jgi:hypothetical protein
VKTRTYLVRGAMHRLNNAASDEGAGRNNNTSNVSILF